MELKVYRPKIWDIVPTRLKEVTMLSALKLRTGSHKTVHPGYQRCDNILVF